MKETYTRLLGFAMLIACGAGAAAQDNANAAPPKVIAVVKQYMKPGTDYVAYERAQSAFVALSKRLKSQGHSVALSSISGRPNTIWIARYPTWSAYQADTEAMWAPAAVADTARAIKGEEGLAESIDMSFYALNEELSYHPRPDLSHARFYEINTFHVRLGHRREWMEAVRMYKEGCEKAGNGAHWGMYEITSGGESNTFIALTHRQSLAELDAGMAGSAKFVEAMGGIEGMRKFDDLYGQAVDSAQTEIYSIDPNLSYPEQAWVNADPDFWKPKPAAAPTSKPSAKPKQASLSTPATR